MNTTIIEVIEPDPDYVPHLSDRVLPRTRLRILVDNVECRAEIVVKQRINEETVIEIDGHRPWYPAELWVTNPSGVRSAVARDAGILGR